MVRDKSIVIDQALHGYDNGHSLLSSSVELISDVKRIMLPISDMSGSAMIGGFEEYITGYPLKDIHSFAIAKTWYANEMIRPGCVWTHTLIIDFEVLPEITNVHVILDLFRRPFGAGDVDFYRNRIEISRSSTDDYSDPSLFYEFPPDLIKSLISKLYEGDVGRSVLVKSENSFNYDKLLLKLWLQQWPRLKRNFTFCSGAIEPRTIGQAPLVLQVIPFRASRNLNRATVIDSQDYFDYRTNLSEEWVELIYQDFLKPSLLRNFGLSFGADMPPEPNTFRLLAEAFIFFNKSAIQLQETVKYLAELLPSQTLGFNLKASLLEAPKPGLEYFLPKYDEDEILFVLSTTKYYAAFDYVRLKFQERFLNRIFGASDVDFVLLERIIRDEPNVIAERVFEVIANRLPEVHLKSQFWKSSDLLSVLVDLNPKLAYNPELWKESYDKQSEIIRSLQRNVAHKDFDWVKVIRMLIEMRSNINPKIFEFDVQRVSRIILDYCDSLGRDNIPYNWISYLEFHGKDVLDWLANTMTPSDKVLQLVLSILDPNADFVVNNGAHPWIGLLNGNSFRDKVVFSDLSSFSLTIAFNLSGPEAIQIFGLTFETVYELLAASKLPDLFWNYLEVHTKPLTPYRNWDRCKKLVHALVDDIVSKGYRLDDVLSMLANESIKNKVTKRYIKMARN